MQAIPVWKLTAMAATTAAVTVGSWYFGAKYKHPVAGALIGFFLISPIANIPMAASVANELAGSSGPMPGTTREVTPAQTLSFGVTGASIR